MRSFQVDKIFTTKSDKEFQNLCLDIFLFQYQNNPVYKQYVDLVKNDTSTIKAISDIPFLPIELFKSHKIIHKNYNENIVFLSSGTTSQNRSKHFVADESIYKTSFIKTFESFYGNIKDYCLLALLPGYLERKGSSLIYMVKELMQISDNEYNGFFVDNFSQLKKNIKHIKKKKQKYILIGVSHALIDFANEHSMDLSDGIVMETGGMKGRKKEMLKEELHNYLKKRFNVSSIHSEYGMTELLSQAYSKGDGLFYSPNWMKILIRNTYDPFSYLQTEKTGGINIIDLANVYSCSFIETKDLGIMHKNGQFEITGRFDNSDIRGCNLLL